jgi:hypothetical protein
MAFGAVEGRSQTNVRERLSAAPRSENIAVLQPAARSRRTTAGAETGEAGKAEGEDISAGMVRWMSVARRLHRVEDTGLIVTLSILAVRSAYRAPG